MAFPVVQAVATGTRAQISGSTICNAPVPASIAVGDLIVAVASASSANPVPNDATWTTLYTDANGNGVFYKLALSADAAASSFPFVAFAGNSNVESCTIQIMRITGHDPTTPINASHFHASLVAGSTATDTTGITPATLQCLLLIATTGLGTSSKAVSAYSIGTSNPSWTEVADTDSNGSAGTSFILTAVAKANQTSNPGTATGTVSTTFTGSQSQWMVGIIAVQPPITVAAPIMSLASTFLTPVFAKIIGAPIMSLAATFIAPAVTNIGHAWRTTAKSVTSWTDLPKS